MTAAGDWRERFRRSTDEAIRRIMELPYQSSPAQTLAEPDEDPMTTLDRAYRLLRDTEAAVRSRCSWRLSRAVWDRCRAEDADDLATGVFDLPATLFGLPVVVDDTLEGSNLVLVTPGVRMPPTIAQLPRAERAAAERAAADMAAYFGDTSVPAVERCLDIVSQALDAGVESYDVMAPTDLRTMADGETRELARHRFQLPIELVPSVRAARQAREPYPARWDHLAPEVQERIEQANADMAAAYSEPDDPVDWLERNLDQVAAGQDAASIKARLAAVEDTLAEVAPGNQPETNWADSHPDPYGIAAGWSPDRPTVDYGPGPFGPTPGPRCDNCGAEVDHTEGCNLPEHPRDHYDHVHWSGQIDDVHVYAGPADGSTPPLPIGHVATVNVSRLRRGQVRCSTCQAEVEQVRVEREDIRRHLYPDSAFVVAGRPTMTVYPCGHRGGFTWEDPSHATEVDT